MFNPDTWRAWDQLVEATHETGFMQSSWWARFRVQFGFEYFTVILKDAETIIGGALVAKETIASGLCFYYIQEGPVLPSDAADAQQVFEAVLKRIAQHRDAEVNRVSHVRIEPRWERLPAFVRGFCPPAFGDQYREPRRTLCIDLRMPQEALLAQMKPKGRYNIRLAQRHGVSIVEDNSTQAVEDFIDIQRQTAQRQQLGKKPRKYFRNLAKVMVPDRKASLFFAEYGGRRLACALVVYFGRRATYFYGGSLVQDRQVMAPYLLHFEIMRAARAAGYEEYDLWGVAAADRPDHPWHAISTFKRKFGGREVKLTPTLDLVYDAAAYAEFVAAECVDTLDAAEYEPSAEGS